MAVLAHGIPEAYDLAINGLGYLLFTEMQTPFAPLRSAEEFRKVGRSEQVPRSDTSEEMSENKIDDNRWSSQRSFYSGAGQKRLDSPNFSDGEAYLRSKNVDVFRERGEFRMSRAFEVEQTGIVGGNQGKGYVTNTATRLMWATPRDGAPAQTHIKILNSYGSSPTERDFASTWPTNGTISGLTNDGQYVYASHSDDGVWRGEINSSDDLTQWKTRGQRDIAFVKQRILGHTTDGGSPEKARVYETDPASGTENLLKEYGAGWSFPTDNPAHVFAEIKGFACWAITNGNDGTLWLWDGENDPFQTAKFPGLEAHGVISYAESVLYVLTKESGGAFDSDHWAIIECQVSPSGDSQWDVLHRIEGPFMPVLTAGEREILFPVQIVESDYAGLDTDDGVLNTDNAPTVAALNLANGGLSPAKHWGLYESENPVTLAGPLWGETGFTKPNITFWNKATVLVGENGEVRVTKDHYATEGQLLSSAIDKNIDSDKMFLLGEMATEPLPAETTARLEFQTTDPETETPLTRTVGSITANGKTLLKRLSANGVKAPFLHFRLTLTSDGDATPVVRKAGVGCVYGRKPPYEHYLVIKALPTMSLRNGNPWPIERSQDTICRELEELRDSAEVVDYQEPTGGAPPRSPVKVQVSDYEKRMIHLPNSGWGSVVTIKLTEVPA